MKIQTSKNLDNLINGAIGLDLGKQSIFGCFLRAGHDPEPRRFASDADGRNRLDGWIKSAEQNNGRVQIGIEAGRGANGLYRYLKDREFEVVVIHAASIGGRRQTKTDAGDAKMIARALLLGVYQEVDMCGEATQKVRDLVRGYHDISWDLTRDKAQLAGYTVDHYDYYPDDAEIDMETGEVMTDSILTPRTAGLLRRIKCLKEDRKQQREQVETVANDNHHREQVKCLVALPGNNYVRAMTQLIESGDVGRFGDVDKFARYCGVVTKQHQSGNANHLSGTADGHKYLSYVLNQSAGIFLTRLAKGGAGVATDIEGLPAEMAEIAVSAHSIMSKKYFKMKDEKCNQGLIRGALAHLLANAVYKVLMRFGAMSND